MLCAAVCGVCMCLCVVRACVNTCVLCARMSVMYAYGVCMCLWHAHMCAPVWGRSVHVSRLRASVCVNLRGSRSQGSSVCCVWMGPLSSLICTQGCSSGLLAGPHVLRITQRPPRSAHRRGRAPRVRQETLDGPRRCAAHRRNARRDPAPLCYDPGPGQARTPCLSFPMSRVCPRG